MRLPLNRNKLSFELPRSPIQMRLSAFGLFLALAVLAGCDSFTPNEALPPLSDATTDPATRSEMLKQAQTIISEDYVNAYLFELPMLSVANAKLKGLWANLPTQATDLTAVYWDE